MASSKKPVLSLNTRARPSLKAVIRLKEFWLDGQSSSKKSPIKLWKRSMLVSNPKSETRELLLKYAGNILSRRPYFRHTLKAKLILRAKKLKLVEANPIIDSILEDLARSGYLDDQYLAEAYVRRQLGKGYGPRLISLKLGCLHLDHDSYALALD